VKTRITSPPILVSRGDAVRDLPPIHRDPFDRMLVARALVEDLVIVSADPALRRYKAAVVWD
jgi:PIN domain nuclease of toxin-antitoxin system